MSTAITPILLQVTSPAFKEDDFIPSKYGYGKESINPPVSIKNIPAETKSLALVVDDPDAPAGPFVHWVMWNIDPMIKTIEENSTPGTQGKNGNGNNGYTGPYLPFGIHHYHFKVYALDTKLDLKDSAGKQSLEGAMKHHIIARGELIGLYKKP